MKIAIDAMGGDNAPRAIVEGTVLAAKEFTDTEFQLYGKESAIRKYLTQDERIEVIHTDEKIDSEDDPVRSVRRKKEASMVLAARAVKEGKADALFSAGNTGALLASGLLIVGRIKGIDRPGLLVTLPTLSGSVSSFNLMDVGANADCKPAMIDQFATLGSYYAQSVQGIRKPRVGLLNNGTEDNKGNELAKQSYQLLKENKDIDFIGNVEARDLLEGTADVVVTDGFTGNAVLKTIEGTALNMVKLVKKTIMENGLKSKVGGLLLKDSLSNLKGTLDYSKHGGSVLLGLKAPVIKTHGSTEKESVYYTIRQIHEMLSSNVVTNVVEHFEKGKEPAE